MKAAVWYQAKDVRVIEREIKPLLSHEVKIRVAWTGICGSDLHEYLHGPIAIPVGQPNPLTGEQAPLTLGHEFSGVVEEVGSEVTRFKKGDRIAVNPLVTYGNKPPETDIYDGFTFIGLGKDGGFADYSIIPEKNVYALPETLSLEEGALVEPAAVAVQAIKEADLRIGQTVAVFGAGPIGLLIILAAKAAGASKIIALDLSESRLEKAKAVGATHIINPGEQNPIQAIQQIIPEGADVTFEAAGAESTFHQSIKATKPRGVVVIVSLFNGPVRFNPMFLTISGVRITSSAAYEPSSFQTAIDLIASGAINAKSIITNRIELDHIVEAGFQALTNDKSQSKILVKLSGES